MADKQSALDREKETMSITSRDAQIAVNGAFAQAESFVSNNIEGFEPSEIDAVATLVRELGTAFARNRLAVIAEVSGEYPDAPARGGYPPRKTASGGSGGKTVSDPSAPVSDGQKKFISNLLEEKVYDGTVDFSTLTMGTASALIDTLKAAPTA